MKIRHIPVLLKEAINYLDPKSNRNFIDCTLGNGGHSEAILEKNGPNGKLLGIDMDKQSIDIATKRLNKFRKRAILVEENFKDIKSIVYEHKFDKISGVLLDLGLSSLQLEIPERGFSFQKEGFLDMRFGKSNDQALQINANKIINSYSEKELFRIFKEYGEERFSKSIARIIVKERKIKPITKTTQLVEIIKKTVPKKCLYKKIHPATRIFQALRITVNRELQNLNEVLPDILEILEPGGRIVVISYHSLEDRIVKHFFKAEARGCVCPSTLPECRCDHKAKLEILTSRVVRPADEEILINPRARSAKLRAAMKIFVNR